MAPVQKSVRLSPPRPIRIGPLPTRRNIPWCGRRRPVGLSLAIDLAQRGQSVVLLDDADRIGEGSARDLFSKRSSSSGIGSASAGRMVDKGVVWSVGRFFTVRRSFINSICCRAGAQEPAFITSSQF